MDYFNGITNDEFKDYYLINLHSIMELNQYIYPDEFLEPSDAIDEHIIHCQNLLRGYLLDLIRKNYDNLNEKKCLEIYEEKRKQLHSLLNTANENYYEKVKVNYIDL